MLAMILLHYALGYNVIAIASDPGTVCTLRTRIEGGWVCGLWTRTPSGELYASFKGVPYAQQPVGKLRFKELQPINPWNHHLDATAEGPVCPQHDEIYGNAYKPNRGMSEACIYANIYIPSDGIHLSDRLMTADINRKGLPILVFIHGGGFQSGSSNSDIYGPEYLVSKGVIVITFNYRLNVFGFLSLNTSEIPGNNGLRDQVTFLRWLQRNAKAFGGDPQEVTVMGHSAGAVMAHLLALSDATTGLFKRCISLSGHGIPSFYTTSPVYARTVAAQFLNKLGIELTDPSDIHKRLLDMPLEKIMEANSAVQYDTGVITFSPVVESKFPGVIRILDDDPLNLIKCGRDKNIPIIIGFTDNEAEIFRWRFEYLDVLGRIQRNPLLVLSPRLVYSLPLDVALERASRVQDLYFQGKSSLDKYIKIIRDTFFVYPALKLAQLRSEMNAAPLYMYKFAYESELNVLRKALWLNAYKGATHIEDITFIFRVNSIIGDSELPAHDKSMVDWMTSFVTNFMRCNDPTCSKGDLESPWPRVLDKRTLNYQNIAVPTVFSNMGPTIEEWEMIRFHGSLERRDGTMNATCPHTKQAGKVDRLTNVLRI